MNRVTKMMVKGSLFGAMIMGLAGCSSAVDTSTAESAYLSFYDILESKKFDNLDSVYIGTDADKTNLESLQSQYQFNDIEVQKVQELYNDGNGTELHAFYILNDYGDTVEDKPGIELMAMRLTDEGYRIIGNDYVEQNLATDTALQTLFNSYNGIITNFEQTPEFQEYYNTIQQFNQNHADALQQLEQQAQQWQQQQLEQSNQNAANAAINEGNAAMDAANQSPVPTQPVLPIQ